MTHLLSKLLDGDDDDDDGVIMLRALTVLRRQLYLCQARSLSMICVQLKKRQAMTMTMGVNS